MARRHDFKSEESYRRYKRNEYTRYYGQTQLYPARRWTTEEEDFIVNNSDMFARDLSVYLQRSIKSVEHRKGVLRKKGLLPAIGG